MPEETILAVDDEAANLHKLRRTFFDRHRVLTAASGAEGLALAARNPETAVIIADQRMPDMTGVEFLLRSQELLPAAIRIILTGYTDPDVLMEAINRCRVYRYIVKPWDPPDMVMAVERGLETYRLTMENEGFRRELVRRERLLRELEIARDIQRYILPPRCPELEGYDMGVEYHPAREVGGDLYDFESNGETLRVVIGDVSGKSIPAALYGAVFSGQLQALFPGVPSPARTLRTLNGNLVARYPSENYIAVACCRVNLADGSAVLSNGGMPFPFLVHERGVLRLELPGTPLGLLPEAEYDELEFQMAPGDTLILASDGVTDALDAGGRFYDLDRFVDSIRRHASEEVPELLARLHGELRRFTRDAEISDDVTLIALRRRR